MSVLGLLGKKAGMTQVFDEDGTAIPVTVLEAGPCVVVQVKTDESDGYTALQLGFGRPARQERENQPYAGHFEQAGVEPKKHLREFPVADVEGYEPGDDVTVDIFEDVEKVDVRGTTRGRGFSGMVRRHGSSTGPKSHGSRNIRKPGATGQAADPSRVFKGKKMPGQYGNETDTQENLEVVRVDPDRDVLLVKGSVPGHEEGIVEIYYSKQDRANHG